MLMYIIYTVILYKKKVLNEWKNQQNEWKEIKKEQKMKKVSWLNNKIWMNQPKKEHSLLFEPIFIFMQTVQYLNRSSFSTSDPAIIDKLIH